MINKNDWIVMLINEHFILQDTLSTEQFKKIEQEAEEKIKFKDSLLCPKCKSNDTYKTALRSGIYTNRCNNCGEYFKWHHTKQKKGKRSI